MDYSADMAIEVGKNRIEALGEVEESADLLRYYAQTMVDNDGYDHEMGNLGDAAVHTRSVLRPHGVFAVISPFNFPMALAGGPAGGALVAGNCVVFKPASQGRLTGLKLYEVMHDAGVPAAAFQIITGPGSTIGQEIQDSPDVDGLTFTGSYEVGMQIYRHFAKDYPKPAICEMGGKNPAIVSAKADLDKATDGVMRSAFGYSGQKCSACSRVYVERPVFDEFKNLLVEKASKLKVGDPRQRDALARDGRLHHVHLLVLEQPQQSRPAFNCFDLAEDLAGIPPGRARQGIAIGQEVARQILDLRADDGSSAIGSPSQRSRRGTSCG
jgi:1-pyrroline-5-carboxylate dehydrogenase